MMRKTVFWLCLGIHIAFAAELAGDTTKLQTLLQEVKQSSGDARRRAMNTLKLYLRSMKRAKRIEAMRYIRRKLQGASHSQRGATLRKEKATHSQMSSIHAFPGGGASPMRARPQAPQKAPHPRRRR